MDTSPTTTQRFRIPLLLLLGAVFAASHASIIHGQFTGEDEALQWHACRRILTAFAEQNPFAALRAAANVLLTEYHPPLRYLLSLPGVAVFPRAEVGLRLGAVVGSAWMTWLLARIAGRLGGPRLAWITAFTVAASGVYVWTSMAFAWGWLTAFVCAALLLLWEPESLELSTSGKSPRLWLAFLSLFCAYLVNSGAILFSAGLVACLILRNIRRLPRLVLAGLPVALVYALYWILFLLLPENSGQWAQTTRRSGMGGWNLTAFLENLQGWNAYGFPLLFNLLWIGGAVLCYTQRRHLLFILLPFSFVWSFWLQGQSHQYFLLGTLPLVPFGLHRARNGLRGPLRPVLLVSVIFTWNLSLFQLPYPAKQGALHIARPWIRIGQGYAGRWHNAREPWREIAAHLKAIAERGERWWCDFDGPLGIFYLPHEPGRYYGDPPPRGEVWVLTRNPRRAAGEELISFPGSDIRLIPPSRPLRKP